MGLKDTFHLDRETYRRKLAHRSTVDLQTHEIIKTRQQASASIAIASGVGFAPFTMGKSLVGTAYGARRMYVAAGKLEMIEAELRSRGKDLHATTTSDILVPLCISAATFGVGAGLDTLLEGATAHLQGAIDTALAAAHSSQAATGAAPITDIGPLLHGAVQGLEMQTREVGSLLTGGHAAAVATSTIDASVPAGVHVLDAASPGLLKGVAGGMAAANMAEVHAAKWVAGKATEFLIDRDRRDRVGGVDRSERGLAPRALAVTTLSPRLPGLAGSAAVHQSSTSSRPPPQRLSTADGVFPAVVVVLIATLWWLLGMWC